MTTEIKILGPGDEPLFENVAAGVFDCAINARRTSEFLSDPRHHIAVAVDEGIVVGFVSAVHYVHPDKNPELWVNEVGVAPSHRQRGLAGQLLKTILELGRRLGCSEAWVLTDESNTAARRLYFSAGGTPHEDLTMFTFKLE